MANKDMAVSKKGGIVSPLQNFENKAMEIWNNQDEIRKLFAPTLSDEEFNYFMSLGITMQANPFLREIWAVKYGNNPAQIFLGRDFYRRKAQEQSSYQNHAAESIYSNDTFSYKNGIVEHEYNLADRGALLGAYCLVWKKGFDIPYYQRVSFAEYNLNQSLWTKKPETMIKKVAEAQGLRGAFQGVFSGTYDESEQWAEAHVVESPPMPEPGDSIAVGKRLIFNKEQWYWNGEGWQIEPIQMTQIDSIAAGAKNPVRDLSAQAEIISEEEVVAQPVAPANVASESTAKAPVVKTVQAPKLFS